LDTGSGRGRTGDLVDAAANQWEKEFKKKLNREIQPKNSLGRCRAVRSLAEDSR